MAFHGWKVEALEFFEGLEADNSKAYWQRHKDVYETIVRAPMEELLTELEPDVRRGQDLPALPRRSLQPRQVPLQDRDRGDGR